MKRALKYLLAALVAVVIFLAGWNTNSVMRWVRSLLSEQTNTYVGERSFSRTPKLTSVLELIENKYVDSLSCDSLQELAIPAIRPPLRLYPRTQF